MNGFCTCPYQQVSLNGQCATVTIATQLVFKKKFSKIFRKFPKGLGLLNEKTNAQNFKDFFDSSDPSLERDHPIADSRPPRINFFLKISKAFFWANPDQIVLNFLIQIFWPKKPFYRLPLLAVSRLYECVLYHFDHGSSLNDPLSLDLWSLIITFWSLISYTSSTDLWSLNTDPHP